MARNSIRSKELTALVIFAVCVQGVFAGYEQGYMHVDLQWTYWSTWSVCTATCSQNNGIGNQTRIRRCMLNNAYVDITACQYHFHDEPISNLGDSHVVIKRQDKPISNLGDSHVVIKRHDEPISNLGDSHVVIKRQENLNDVDYQTCYAFCPSNIWSDWSSFTGCSVTCGTGDRTRSRYCTTGNDCIGDRMEQTACSQTSCVHPINGQWGAWSSYDQCSATCGHGVEFRARYCDSPAPAHGGLECIGTSHHFQSCNIHACSIVTDGGWTNFTDLACSTTCGVGVVTSVRTCTNPVPSNGGKNCTGSSYMYTPCYLPDCPINGGWDSWSEWSKCSDTTGIGVKLRTRHCTSPAPRYGGNDCAGGKSEIVFCLSHRWSDWAVWSSCDVTCGNGTTHRSRICVTGSDCVGPKTETSTCNLAVCTLDSAYGAWSNWSDCSATCGFGISMRTRTCSWKTVLGGQDCTTGNLQRRDCYLKDCLTDSAYSAWSNWSDCSVTCGSGMSTRTRACSIVQGVQNCSEGYLQRRDCHLKACPIAGGYGAWSNWSDCSSTCGNSSIHRIRQCDSPAPQNGGQVCSGDSQETQDCKLTECVVDGGWSSYSTFPCSVTCGIGNQVALRECNNPAPQNGGKFCVGISHHISECHMPSCAVDGDWSDWSVFSPCGSVCGDGYKLRFRSCTNPTPANGGNNCTGSNEERTTCNSGPCPHDVPICEKAHVVNILQYNDLNVPTSPTPCRNMNDIPQATMVKNVCNAPDDVSLWISNDDIRQTCDNVTLFSPLTKLNRASNSKEYGVVLDCYKGKLKFATETCDSGVQEVEVDLEHDDTWEYFTTKW